MKIALDLKQEHKAMIVKDLINGGNEISSSSFNTIWVYKLSSISCCKNIITLNFKDEKGMFRMYNIDLEDIEYYEIHIDKGE